MNSQNIIVYNEVTVKNTDYQDHSELNRKSETIVTAVPLKHKTGRTVTRVAPNNTSVENKQVVPHRYLVGHTRRNHTLEG